MRHIHKSLAILLSITILMPFVLTALPTVSAAEKTYNFAIGQTVSASNSYTNPEGFYRAHYLVDGEWGTYKNPGDKLGWHTDPDKALGETTPVTITVTLDSVYELDEIILYPQKWANGKTFPRDYLLQVSMNGDDWTTVAEGKNMNAQASGNLSVQPISHNVETVSLKYFRMYITRHSAETNPSGTAYYSALGELELMGRVDANHPENTRISINKTALRMQPGEWDVLKVAAGSALIDAPDVAWSSDNSAIATIDAEGKVTAVAYGTTTLRGMTAEKEYTCTILVDDYSVLDNLMITSFRSPSKVHLTPETYDLLKAAGFTNIQNENNTTVNTISDNLLMAQYSYERGMDITASIGAWKDGFLGISYEEAQERALLFSHVPGVGGIYILDEPYNANAYASVFKPIKEVMPYADVHLNFLPLHAYPNAKVYAAQMNDLYQLTGGRLDYLMYDRYPFTWADRWMDEAGWLQNLDVVRELGLKTGAKTGTFILSISSETYNYRRPEGTEIRYMMYTALAYGYKQIAYFCWETPTEFSNKDFGPAIVDREGNPTEIYEPVKEVNNEALMLGPTLMQLDSVDAYIVGSSCGYDNALPDDFFLQPNAGANLVISHMRNPETGEDYAFVVNRNRYSEQTVILTPADYIVSIQEVSNQTGSLENVTRNADGTYSVTLRAGAGKLFKMPNTCNYTPDYGKFIVEEGENLALKGNIRSDDSVGADGFYLAYVNDGERSGTDDCFGWDSTVREDGQAWLEVDLGGVAAVDRVVLYPEGDERRYAAYFPSDFTIELSIDGETWQTVANAQNYPRPDMDGDIPTFTFEAVPARYVRLNITKMRRDNRARIAEFEVYGIEYIPPIVETIPETHPITEPSTDADTDRQTDTVVTSDTDQPLIDNKKEKGCASVVGMSVALLIALCGVAMVLSNNDRRERFVSLTK